MRVWRTFKPLYICTTPWRLIGMYRRSSRRSRRISLVLPEAEAVAKSSTWCLKRRHYPLIKPEYKQGSCLVGFKPRLQRISLMCFSHSRGDYGRPCIARSTGITAPSGIGLRPLLFHQLRNARSGRRKNPCFGGGASPNALLTSDPWMIRFPTAAME